MRLNDKIKISMEELKHRLAETEKNDPFEVVASLLKQKGYDALAQILRGEPNLNPRQVAAIPAALLHTNANYQGFFEAMRARNAGDIAAYCVRMADHIADKYHVLRDKVSVQIRSRNPLPRSGNEEYERMYELYCT